MLISILGDLGTGKTLFSTFLAVSDSRLVYSNYKIKIPNWRMLNPETLIKLPPNTLVIIDEAYNWLESRLSSRAINMYSSYVLMQSRKRELDIIITDQLVSMIDVRYRLMTNYEIQCEATESGFEYRIFKLSRYHNFKPRKLLMPFSIAEQLYPLYDSWERIDPIDDNLIFKVSKDKTDILKRVDAYADELLRLYPTKITKGVVSDFCLRNDIEDSYRNLIFDAIKARQLKSLGGNKS